MNYSVGSQLPEFPDTEWIATEDGLNIALSGRMIIGGEGIIYTVSVDPMKKADLREAMRTVYGFLLQHKAERPGRILPESNIANEFPHGRNTYYRLAGTVIDAAAGTDRPGNRA